MMNQNVLYTFRRCPYAMRARMALAQAGTELELREILLKDKPQDMLASSPKGTVPTLITASGEVIDESIDVMYWALKQSDPDGWLNNNDAEHQWIDACDNHFKALLDKYKYADRHTELNESEHREKTLPFIIKLNEQLKITSFLTDNKVSIADIAIFPFIRQYAMVDNKWFDAQPYPALQKWLAELLDSDLFKNIMKKYKLYNDGHTYAWPETENNRD